MKKKQFDWVQFFVFLLLSCHVPDVEACPRCLLGHPLPRGHLASPIHWLPSTQSHQLPIASRGKDCYGSNVHKKLVPISVAPRDPSLSLTHEMSAVKSQYISVDTKWVLGNAINNDNNDNNNDSSSSNDNSDENDIESKLKSIMLSWIRWYRNTLSPIMPPNCRFFPSCSS